MFTLCWVMLLLAKLNRRKNLKQIQPTITDSQHRWLKKQKEVNFADTQNKLVQDGLELLMAKQERMKRK